MDVKDLGRQGLTYARPDSPYGALVADFVAKKLRLGVNQLTVAAPTTFGVIGSGWRCAFFLRLAGGAPDRLRATGVLTRSAERGAQVTARWGVPTCRSAGELLAAELPNYVIVSVPRAVTPDATRELVALGVHVLAETPPARDLPGLRALWADVGAGGLVQVAEQYLLMPGHAARARGEGPEPYPLAEGVQDHLIGLAIGESAAAGRDVTTTTEPWAA